MTKYHVGCGITAIYAGTLNKKGDMWINKSDVTDEAFSAVAQYCVNNNQAMEFSMDGKKYRLAVSEIKDGEDDGKPYLEKIKARVKFLREHRAEFLTSDCKLCIDSQEVLDFIDELLSEDGEEV